MTTKHELQLQRYRRVLAGIARWQAKERRARNALRKLRRQQAYYQRLMGGKPPLSDQELTDRKASRKINATARKRKIWLDQLKHEKGVQS